MTDWTSGEWLARECENGEWEIVKPDADKPTQDDQWFIAVICDSADDGDASANAHLIAAAPDLYAALERMMTEDSEECWAQARTAIAKARGENA